MPRHAAALALALALAAPAGAQELAEPATGVRFPVARDGHTLLGLGLRVKKIAFFKAKVYVVGLYVSDAALAGPLAGHKGRAATPELYRELLAGDYDKRLVLRFTRNVGQKTIQEAMRDALQDRTDAKLLDQFVSYFTELKEGQEAVLRWVPGGSLAVTMAGQERPTIASKDFATALFGLYLGDKPIQPDIKAGLVSRVPAL